MTSTASPTNSHAASASPSTQRKRPSSPSTGIPKGNKRLSIKGTSQQPARKFHQQEEDEALVDAAVSRVRTRWEGIDLEARSRLLEWKMQSIPPPPPQPHTTRTRRVPCSRSLAAGVLLRKLTVHLEYVNRDPTPLPPVACPATFADLSQTHDLGIRKATWRVLEFDGDRVHNAAISRILVHWGFVPPLVGLLYTTLTSNKYQERLVDSFGIFEWFWSGDDPGCSTASLFQDKMSDLWEVRTHMAVVHAPCFSVQLSGVRHIVQQLHQMFCMNSPTDHSPSTFSSYYNTPCSPCCNTSSTSATSPKASSWLTSID
jgi:hypothetical protein